MSSRQIPKGPDKPLTFVQAPRAAGNYMPLRANFLLLSGIALVLIAATMIIGAMLG
jgi:hypothetical protein